MSIIFGTRRSPGAVVTREEILRLAAATQHYAIDGTWITAQGRVGMGFQPYHAHERSNLEAQPAIDSQGNMLSLDGRIDNHAELRQLLDLREHDVSDSLIVLAAFRRWGEALFSRLVGDWALALWSAMDRVIYLARDHAGARTLYFHNHNGTFRWATYLDTFFAGREVYSLDEQYVAQFLCGLPTFNLTPYQGIRAVSPAHYLTVSNDNAITETAHWNWMVDEQIHYQSTAEYKEHFLALFKQAVDRRTGFGAPILAELSGGVDSTSIVCMSDYIRKAHGANVKALLDTVSYYDPSEPNWNEEPYFSITEERRGKKGIHINCVTAARTFGMPDLAANPSASLWPGTDRTALEEEYRLNSAIGNQDYRVILSGIGGDELLGGIPTPQPELADLLASLNVSEFFDTAIEWCISNRTSILQTLLSTVKFATDLYLLRSTGPDAPNWVTPKLRRLSARKLDTHPCNAPIGFRPTSIENGVTWWNLLGMLPHLLPASGIRREYRFPYLDRDLVDFLFRTPRRQLIRPGRRRALQRDSLANIVPKEILERRRNAFIIRGPLVSLQCCAEQLRTLFRAPNIMKHGFIDVDRLCSALDLILQGRGGISRHAFMRAVELELWLTANCRGADAHPTMALPSLDSCSNHTEQTRSEIGKPIVGCRIRKFAPKGTRPCNTPNPNS